MGAETPVILFTTAPVDYDGFSTRELVQIAGRDDRGRKIRKISVLPRDLEWQKGRYASGMYAVATPEEAARFSTFWDIYPGDTEPEDSDPDDLGPDHYGMRRLPQ